MINFDEMQIECFDFNLMKEELNKIEIYNFDSTLDRYIDGGSSVSTFESVKDSRTYILIKDDKQFNQMISDIKKYSIKIGIPKFKFPEFPKLPEITI